LVQVHIALIGQDLVIRCRQGREIEEFIPFYHITNDLPHSLLNGHHHWYSEGTSCLEIRPKHESWVTKLPRIWRALLSFNHASVLGMASKQLLATSLRLVDIHSSLYKHISVILRPLEQQINGILITVDSNNLEIRPAIHLPRHDLTFNVNSSNQLECQSFPGFVLDTDYHGIGTLIGLETLISLRYDSTVLVQRKLVIPKGAISPTIGLYGHPLISITPQATGGYFAYDVDNLLGRLHGSRSAESDLFLIQLHAFTSSFLADDLTGRTGTSEALDYLSGSTCLSMYALTAEARTYLDNLATLTPLRTLSSSHGQKVETIKWNPVLPILSQHPAFLSLVEAVLDHWRRTEVFHSFGDPLKAIRVPSGMDYLSARAGVRNWIFHHSAHKLEGLSDVMYQPRDCIQDSQSQIRERNAFQVAQLSHPFTSSFPHCLSLHDEVKVWTLIQNVESWNWDDIQKWFPYANAMGTIWRTLYELCKTIQWPPKFNATATLSLLGYSNVPFGVLATLMAVAKQPSLVPLSPPITSPLNLAKGSTFDDQRIREILSCYTTPYQDSDEAAIERIPGETLRAREQRTTALYMNRLNKEMKEATNELRHQWPDVPIRLVIREKRLLRMDDQCLQTLHSALLEWLLNRAFLHHITSIPLALGHLYVLPTILETYSPIKNSTARRSTPFKIPTVKDLMSANVPPFSSHMSIDEPISSNLQSHQEVIPDELADLLVYLRSAAQSRLEKRYLKNLAESILALSTVPFSANSFSSLPLVQELEILQQTTEVAHIAELSRLQKALTPPSRIFALLEAANLSPTITPIVLLRQLSFIKRQRIPHQWREIIVEYAVRIHDAKRANRMIRLYQAQRTTQLSLEVRYRREWEPMHHPDWLLIEIDSDFSIRAEQANMAKEMISPSNGQNSVMQLNMGEGKSSVSICVQYRNIANAL
jgi:hypothetical protein